MVLSEDMKPDIQQVGGAGHRANLFDQNLRHQDAIRPLAGPSSSDGVDDDMQGRKPDLLSVAGPVREQNERFDITEDNKPNINAVAGPSTVAVPQLPTQDDDSDGEEDSAKEERETWRKIEMYQASLTNSSALRADGR
jgi:hypothetical protein